MRRASVAAEVRPNVLTLLGLAACSFWGASAALASVLTALGLRDRIPSILELGLVHVLGIGSVLGLAVLWSDLRARELFAFRRFPLASLGFVAAAMCGISILGSEVANWIVRVGLGSETAREAMWAPEASLDWLAVLFVVAGVVPWTEELLFRGLVLDGLLERLRIGLAVLTSSLLFALFHLDLLQMPLACAAGALLAMFRIRTGSILPCVFGHAVLNAFPFAVTWLFGAIPGYGFERTASLEQPLAFDLLGVALVALGAAGLVRVRRAAAAPRER